MLNADNAQLSAYQASRSSDWILVRAADLGRITDLSGIAIRYISRQQAESAALRHWRAHGEAVIPMPVDIGRNPHWRA